MVGLIFVGIWWGRRAYIARKTHNEVKWMLRPYGGLIPNERRPRLFGLFF
jgi:hypothetical protein